MEEHAWWNGIAALALGLLFALVSGLLWACGGRHRGLLRAKLRLGGLLLGLGALASGCGDKDDSDVMMCYAAGWDSDLQDQPDIAVDNTVLDFGNIATATPEDRTLTVRNEGQATLTLQAVTITQDPNGHGGPFFTEFEGPTTLEPGAELGLDIRFVPMSDNSFSATLTITSDDPDEASLDVALTGRGQDI